MTLTYVEESFEESSELHWTLNLCCLCIIGKYAEECSFLLLFFDFCIEELKVLFTTFTCSLVHVAIGTYLLQDLSSEEGNFPSLNNLFIWTVKRNLSIWSPVDVSVMNGKYFPGEVAFIKFYIILCNKFYIHPPPSTPPPLSLSLSCCHFLLCLPPVVPPGNYCRRKKH